MTLHQEREQGAKQSDDDEYLPIDYACLAEPNGDCHNRQEADQETHIEAVRTFAPIADLIGES